MAKTNQEILKEAMDRFQQIMEYTVMRPNFTNEAGEEQQDDPSQAPSNNSALMDPNAGVPDTGGNMPQDGGAPMGPNAETPAPDGGMGQDAMQGGETQGPEGFNPQVPQEDMSGNIPMDDGMGADGGLQPDDDVIDVSDLTDSQEETQEDVEKLNDKFENVMKYLGKFEELIKSNDEKINDLKAEFEKRNPTQVEKLSMQTARSYPFNTTPEEYWDNKVQTSNYRTDDDNNGKEQGQYVITKNDIDGATDWKTISDSLDDFDFMHQTMKNTMGLPI